MPGALYLTYLNRPDVEALALTDDEILDAVESGLRAQGLGQTVIEPRVHLRPDESFRGHFNVLRGYIAPLGLAGVKVVGDYVDNYELGLPSENGLLTLYDPRTGVPLAVIDAAGLTDMRTGAVSALGARHLARADSRVLGHIGARGTAYWNVRLLAHLFELDEIRVHSRRPESREAFGAQLERDLGRPVIVCDDWESVVRGADIVVEAARLERPGAAAADGVDRARRARDPVRHDERRRALADRHHGQARRRRLGPVPQRAVRLAARPRRGRQAVRADAARRAGRDRRGRQAGTRGGRTRRSCSGTAA